MVATALFKSLIACMHDGGAEAADEDELAAVPAPAQLPPARASAADSGSGADTRVPLHRYGFTAGNGRAGRIRNTDVRAPRALDSAYEDRGAVRRHDTDQAWIGSRSRRTPFSGTPVRSGRRRSVGPFGLSQRRQGLPRLRRRGGTGEGARPREAARGRREPLGGVGLGASFHCRRRAGERPLCLPLARAAAGAAQTLSSESRCSTRSRARGSSIRFARVAARDQRLTAWVRACSDAARFAARSKCSSARWRSPLRAR